METKSNKGIKGILTLTAIFALCVTLVLATTFGLLTDTKTATGTITFDLADYDFQVTNDQESVSGIYPGKSVTTKATTLVNTDDGDGATVGLKGVYVRLEFTGVKVGDDTFSKNLNVTTSNNKIIVSAETESGVAVSNYLEIELAKTAGTDLYWGVVGSEKYAYLVNSSNEKTTLAYSQRSEETKTSANIQFNIGGITDTGSKNGFNDTTGTGGLPNKYQGKTVSISYKVTWGTTPETIGGSTTTNA